MPFKDPVQSLQDILRYIERIEYHIADMEFAAYREDIKTIDAVERNLQRISEAASRLGDQADILCPGLPWHNIRGIGNWLRHEYDRVNLETVWHTLTDYLPPLKAAVLSALASERSSPKP